MPIVDRNDDVADQPGYEVVETEGFRVKRGFSRAAAASALLIALSVQASPLDKLVADEENQGNDAPVVTPGISAFAAKGDASREEVEEALDGCTFDGVPADQYLARDFG